MPRRGGDMLNARLAFSYEMQPGTDQTGPAGRLGGPSAAERREEDEGRGRYKGGGGCGGVGGARSCKLTGRLNNVIKHGPALRRCIIPDLHSRQEVGREGGKERRQETDGGVMVSREKNFRERGHTIGRMRLENKRKTGPDGVKKKE